MRNLKKILALVLALVMTFSVMSVSSAAFKDEANITDVYAESAEVLANLGVFKGYEDGSFNPKGSITRAEVAAIIYRVATGDVSDKQVGIYADYNVFEDVKSTSWYAGYVNYCANANYIKGYGNGKFGPNDTVTGYQALAMILRAVGYDKNGEFTGPSWQVETAKIGNQLDITRNVNAGTLGTPATREVVAEVLFRAINVPTVTYSLGLGYSQYVNALTNEVKNPSLAWANFKLTQVKGTISTATPSYAVIGNYVVVDHDLTWENIGYGAYVWAVPATGNTTKEYKAVSSSVIYGDSLLVNTDNLTYKYLTTYMVTVESDAVVFYNGVKLPTDTMTVAQALAKVGEIGVKVDFIDNDFGGIAEAVVITEYTLASVSGIANDKNTGTNAIVKDTYYFDNATSVKAAKLVCADELSVGEYVTYVDYAGYRYADKVDFAMGEYTKINYVEQYQDNSYVIGGVEYVKAEDCIHVYENNRGDKIDVLSRGFIGEDMVVGTDPYGYMVVVAPYAPADNYLYVIRTNHSDNVAGTVYATVAFADGSIENIYIDNDSIQNFGAIAGCVWTYTVENGVYELEVRDGQFDADNMFHVRNTEFRNWEDAETNFFGHHLTKATVVIDLRGVINRTGDVKIYNGYAEIPSVVDADFCYVTDANGFVVLAYLVAGENLGDMEKEFSLYTTKYSSYYIDEDGNTMYEMDAIVDGERTKVTLTEHQYRYVKNHGVGVYQIRGEVYTDVDGFVVGWDAVISYASFMQRWFDVRWSSNTIVLEDYFGKDNDYSFAYGDDVDFWTFDIANGKAYDYLPTVGSDLKDAHAIVFTSEDNWRVVEEIIIIYGTLSDVAEDHTNFTAFHSNYGYYFAQPGRVTTFLTIEEVTYREALRLIAITKDAVDYAIEVLTDDDSVETADLDDDMTVGGMILVDGRLNGMTFVGLLNPDDFETEEEYALAVLVEARKDYDFALEMISRVMNSLSVEKQEEADLVITYVKENCKKIDAVMADIETDKKAETEVEAMNEALDAIEAALEAQDEAEKILIEAGLMDKDGVAVAAETETETETEPKTEVAKVKAMKFDSKVEYALYLLKAVAKDLADAVKALKELDADLLTEEQAKAAAEAAEAADELAVALVEAAEEIETSEEYKDVVEAEKAESEKAEKLDDLKAAKVEDVKVALEAGIKAGAAAEGIYKLTDDVYIADADVYVVAGDVEFTFEDGKTTLATVIADWTAKIEAAANEFAVKAAVTADMIEEVAAAFVEFLVNLG